MDYAASDPEFVETDVLNVTRRWPVERPRQHRGQHRLPIAARRSPSSGTCSPGARTRASRSRPSSTRSVSSASRSSTALSACADPDRPEELQAVIRGGAVIMRFAHEVIGVVTQTYLDELEDVSGDREIVSRSLLDAVLAGRAVAASSLRDARILGIELLPQNVVIVVRAPVGDDDPATPRSSARARCAGPRRSCASTCSATSRPAARSSACARGRSCACARRPRPRTPSARPRPRTRRRARSTSWGCPSAWAAGACGPKRCRPPTPRPARPPSSPCAAASAIARWSTTTCWSTTCCAPTRTPAA